MGAATHSPSGRRCARGPTRRALEDLERLNEEARRKAMERKGNGLGMSCRTPSGSGSQEVTLYFTADKRVDFRNLVRDLALSFVRIELKQIGVRDEASV